MMQHFGRDDDRLKLLRPLTKGCGGGRDAIQHGGDLTAQAFPRKARSTRESHKIRKASA